MSHHEFQDLHSLCLMIVFANKRLPRRRESLCTCQVDRSGNFGPRGYEEQTDTCPDDEQGQICHMERWYNTLRQSCTRFVRKTLSFSKSDAMHEIVTRLFVIHR